MGIRIVVLDPTAGCPASAVAVQLVGSFRDPAAVKQIAQLVSLAGHYSPLFRHSALSFISQPANRDS